MEAIYGCLSMSRELWNALHLAYCHGIDDDKYGGHIGDQLGVDVCHEVEQSQGNFATIKCPFSQPGRLAKAQFLQE